MYKGDYEEFLTFGENLGQTVNTAVYKRNEYITNKYNITLAISIRDLEYHPPKDHGADFGQQRRV